MKYLKYCAITESIKVLHFYCTIFFIFRALFYFYVVHQTFTLTRGFLKPFKMGKCASPIHSSSAVHLF